MKIAVLGACVGVVVVAAVGGGSTEMGAPAGSGGAGGGAHGTGGASGAAGMTAGTGSGGAPAVGSPGCPLFTADDPWNADVSAAPVDAAWTTKLAALVGDIKLHPDFGSGYGIPIN